MTTLVDLKHQRKAMIDESRAILDTAETEKRVLTADEKQKYDRIMEAGEKLKEQIDTQERSEYQKHIESELMQTFRKTEPVRPKAYHSEPDHEGGLRSWLCGPKFETNRGNLDNMSHCGYDYSSNVAYLPVDLCGRKTRALTTASDSAGKTISQGFVAEIEKELKYISPFRNYVKLKQTPTGNTLKWPTFTDVANTAVKADQTSTMTDATDPTISDVTFGSFHYTSKPLAVSQITLRDNEVDLEELLVEALAERIGRSQETDVFNGNGTTAPQGLLTAITPGVDLEGAALNADDLFDLIDSLDYAYQNHPDCGFVFHQKFFNKIRKLKTDFGYLWQPSLQMGKPDTFLGYPYYISNALDDGEDADEIPCIFGKLTSYVWREVQEITIQKLVEAYASKNQVAFIVSMHGDGRLVGPTSSITCLTTGSSS